jgi:polar amino acid transport system substrate-binding protein
MRRNVRSCWCMTGLWLGLALVLALAWAASAMAAESTLEQVLKRGKLIVGIGLGAPPFGMYDADKKPSGLDVDLAKLIAQELKVEIEWVDTTSVNRIPYLLTNKVDLVIATFSATPERAKQVAFTKPYTTFGQAILGWKNDRSIKSAKDLKGKTVAVTRGTTQDLTLAQLVPEAKIMRYEDDPVTMLAFEQKKVDALVTADVIVMKKVKDNKDMELKGIISRTWVCIGVRHGDQDWLNWLNTFIDIYGGQGKFAELYEKWTGVKMAPALPSW